MHMNILPDDYIIDTEVRRFSQDKGHMNNNGTLLLDLCKQTGLRIFNGRFGNDKGIGKYTFIGSRGSSLVDYVMGTQNLFQFIENFDVSEPNILSDHCIVSFSFVFDKPYINVVNTEYDYVWSNDMKNNFIDGLSSHCMLDKLNNFTDRFQQAENKQDIDECISHFSNVIEEVASPLFQKQINVQLDNKIFPDNHNKWFNEECFEKRAVFFIEC